MEIEILAKSIDRLTEDTRRMNATLSDKVSELSDRMTKVEALAREARSDAARVRSDAEGTEHAILADFTKFKGEIRAELSDAVAKSVSTAIEKYAEERVKVSAKQRREDRNFYLKLMLVVVPLLSGLVSRGAAHVMPDPNTPITLAPAVTVVAQTPDAGPLNAGLPRIQP